MEKFVITIYKKANEYTNIIYGEVCNSILRLVETLCNYYIYY